jgi:uncharacterized LabA/DUF88 family protein
MRRRGKKRGNYAFIDSQNLNLGTQKMGWKMDWAKFRKYLQDKYGVTKAYMFIGYVPEYEDMYNQLHEIGYLIVLKPTVGSLDVDEKKSEDTQQTGSAARHDEAQGDSEEQSDAARKPAVKGNIDAELVLYAMKEINNYDKALVVSGDGDFYCLVEYLAEQKKLLHLMAPNWQYSSLLKPYESYIIRLDKERGNLAYHDRRKTRAAK